MSESNVPSSLESEKRASKTRIPVSEFAEGMDVFVVNKNGREVILAYNEAGYNCTMLDLKELSKWIIDQRPDLLKDL